jgi:aquaporin Z
MLAAGKMKPKDTLFYVVMQCLGAVVGAAVLYWILTGNGNYSPSSNGLGQNGYGATIGGFSVISCFVTEAVLAFIFLLIFFGSTSEKAPKGIAGVAIGLGYGMIYLVSMPITGGSVNPARSLGPAVILAAFAGKTGLEAWNQLWLFWTAPTLGGLICAAVWRFLGQDRNTLDDEPPSDPDDAE